MSNRRLRKLLGGRLSASALIKRKLFKILLLPCILMLAGATVWFFSDNFWFHIYLNHIKHQADETLENRLDSSYNTVDYDIYLTDRVGENGINLMLMNSIAGTYCGDWLTIANKHVDTKDCYTPHLPKSVNYGTALADGTSLGYFTPTVRLLIGTTMKESNGYVLQEFNVPGSNLNSEGANHYKAVDKLDLFNADVNVRNSNGNSKYFITYEGNSSTPGPFQQSMGFVKLHSSLMAPGGNKSSVPRSEGDEYFFPDMLTGAMYSMVGRAVTYSNNVCNSMMSSEISDNSLFSDFVCAIFHVGDNGGYSNLAVGTDNCDTNDQFQSAYKEALSVIYKNYPVVYKYTLEHWSELFPSWNGGRSGGLDNNFGWGAGYISTMMACESQGIEYGIRNAVGGEDTAFVQLLTKYSTLRGGCIAYCAIKGLPVSSVDSELTKSAVKGYITRASQKYFCDADAADSSGAKHYSGNGSNIAIQHVSSSNAGKGYGQIGSYSGTYPPPLIFRKSNGVTLNHKSGSSVYSGSAVHALDSQTALNAYIVPILGMAEYWKMLQIAGVNCTLEDVMKGGDNLLNKIPKDYLDGLDIEGIEIITHNGKRIVYWAQYDAAHAYYIYGGVHSRSSDVSSNGTIRYRHLEGNGAKSFVSTGSHVYDSIKFFGCGPTSCAIVASTLSGHIVTPEEAADKAYEVGAWAKCQGSSGGSLVNVLKAYGLEATLYSKSQFDELYNELKRTDTMAIVCVGKGYFTDGGHFIALTNVAPNGRVYVADPGGGQGSSVYHNGRLRSQPEVTWDWNEVKKQIKDTIILVKGTGALRATTTSQSGTTSIPNAATNDNMDYVRIKDYIPNIVVDIRYATSNNFVNKAVADYSDAYCRYGVIKGLKAAQEEFNSLGYSIKIWDAARSVKTQQALRDAYAKANGEEAPTSFIAAAGYSGHNYGAALDITLVDLKTGAELPMPTGFDDFTSTAYVSWKPGNDAASKAKKEHAELLRNVMEKHGFSVNSHEWWHFDYIADGKSTYVTYNESDAFGNRKQ